MAEKQLYAMTAYAATAWTAPELVVSPQTVGAQGDNGWIQFDTVTYRKTNRAMPGTECWEPGSFTVDGTGFIVSEWPAAPGPMPAPVPDADALPVLDVEAAPALDEITFHVEAEREIAEPRVALEPARTDPLTVMIGGTSSGTVTSSPSGITCAGSTVSCTGWFGEGIEVALTATPDAGLVFVGWAGACSGTTQPCAVRMDGAQSVVAHFASPLQYYHLDVLGSVRMITDATGAVVIRHDYFAFGEDTLPMTGDPRRFTGKELDPETALQYFGARYYRNVWGRFTSVDPVRDVKDAVMDPQKWNRYAYTLSNPIRYFDPDGQWPSEIHENLIRAAFQYLSAAHKETLIQASLCVDSWIGGGQLSMFAYQHGMSAWWQTAEAARAKGDDYIQRWEGRAAKQTGFSEGLSAFGHALHTVTDRTSPAHRGDQVWLDVNFGLIFGTLGRRHTKQEEIISEAEFMKGVNEARSHFLKVFGSERYFQATGCTGIVGCPIPDAEKPWYLRSGGS
jgi:RHS repeat-associated protein